MKKLLFLKLLALVACLSSALSATAYDFSSYYNGTTFYYNILYDYQDNRYVEVTYHANGGNSYSGSVTIPSTVTYNGKTYNVTAIGEDAFCDCVNLTSISIPNSVTSIGEGAFYMYEGHGYGNLTNQITSITIPNSVVTIGNYAFGKCRKLTRVIIGDGVTTIGDEAFIYCESLQHVTFGSNVRSIGANAFYGAGYHYNGSTLVFGIKCKRFYPPVIQSNTFPSEFYSKATVTAPTPFSMSLYQGSALNWSSFTHYSYDQKYDFYRDGVYYLITNHDYNTSNYTVKVTNANGGYGGQFSYSGNVSVPRSAWYSYDTYPYTDGHDYKVTTIGEYAFYETQVINLNSPGEASSLRAQGDLKSVNIGDNVTTIERNAFTDCTGLTSVTLGTGVTSISTEVFKGCTSLAKIYSNRTTPPSITSTTFDNSHYSTAALYVPKSAISSYKSASYWRNFYLILPNDGTELNYALNVGTGNISFTSTGTYPWIVKGDGTRIYAQSGNAGVTSSSSTLSATVSLSKPHTVTFDFKAWGETSGSTNYDKCIFSIDGTTQFSYGARDNEWETFTATIPSGSHTLTWTYSKDSSVNPEGDYFAVDNVKLTEITTQPGDVNGDGNTTIADVSALIDVLLGSSAPSAGADVNGDGQVSIADVSALIDLLLN